MWRQELSEREKDPSLAGGTAHLFWTAGKPVNPDKQVVGVGPGCEVLWLETRQSCGSGSTQGLWWYSWVWKEH